MKTRLCLAMALMLGVGCQNMDSGMVSALGGLLGGGALDSATVAKGLKEALSVGTQRAVSGLSQPGGYGKDAARRLLIPDKLEKMGKTLRRVGLGSLVDDFEGKMNTAAEEAAAKAVPVFANAVRSMSFTDAMGILKGGPTAATDYFKANTSDQLRAMYSPIVRSKMEQVGTAKLYNSLMEKYNAIPLTSKPDFSLEKYVTDKALTGLFSKLGEMEKDIRENPAARTTALLKRVFANQ
ncbi:MAG: DUF4197 domain-containing protein [Victivallales bacterium]|nr:DUF4197 domain-containing protein [Victivallales bacterium]